MQPTAATVARPSAPLEPRAAFQFGLSTIILAITIVAVLLGVFRMSPGLGVLLAVAVAPALLRVAVVSAKARSRGESVSPDRKVSIFLRTAGATLGVVGAVAAVLIVLAAVAVLSAVSAILSICTGGF